MFSVPSFTCQASSAIRDRPSSVKEICSAFGCQQGLILLGEGCVRLREDAFEIFRSEGAELHPNGQPALQLRNQIRGLGQMKGAGGDEENVIGLHHAVFGGDGAAFDQRQQVALHAFAGHVRTHAFAALGDLVQLVDEDDAGLLDGFDGAGF